MNILIDMRPFIESHASNGEMFSVELLHAFFRNHPSHIFYLWTTGKKRLEGEIAFEEYHNVRRIHTQISERRIAWWNFFTGYPAIDDITETIAMKNGHLAWNSKFDVAFFSSPTPKIIEDNCLTVQFINHLKPIHFPLQFSKKQKKYHSTRYYKKACEQMDIVVVPSEFARSNVIQELGVENEKIFISRIGIEQEYQAIDDEIEIKDHIELKSSLGDTEKTLTLRKRWEKLPENFFFVKGENENISSVLEAYKMYRSRYGDNAWDMIICEEEKGILTAYYEYTHNKLDKIHILSPLGVLDERYVLSRAKASIDPSVFDEEGIFTRKSLRCGTPVICSQHGVLPSIIPDPGFLFDPLSWQSLLEQMKIIHQFDVQKYTQLRHDCILHSNAPEFLWDDISSKIMTKIAEELEIRETEE